MRIPRNWGIFVFVGLLSGMPTFTNIKIGGIQPVDFVVLGLLAFCSAKWLCAGFKFSVNAKLGYYARRYIFLLFVLLCFAILAFRMPMFPLEDVSLLKTPLLFSASKFLQLAAVVCGFLWLTNALLSDADRLRQALSIYWWVGIVSCLYAIVSYGALAVLHVDLLGAYGIEVIRARGFFNEGGPFGIYVVSIVIVGLLRRSVTGKRLRYHNIAICVVAFFFSQSHAALFLIALLFLFSILSAASFRKRVWYALLATTVLWIVAAVMGLGGVLAAYIDGYQNIEGKMAMMSGIDPNLVMGRIAAAYIVPRMVEAHPITGIGIGNYSLMRNDPHYLGTLPEIRDLEDLPGMGLVSDTAEIGIPAVALLSILLLAPYRRCKRKSTIIGTASLFQLFAHLMGVHLNFFYPWFISACAIAANEYHGATGKVRDAPVKEHPLVSSLQ